MNHHVTASLASTISLRMSKCKAKFILTEHSNKIIEIRLFEMAGKGMEKLILKTSLLENRIGTLSESS